LLKHKQTTTQHPEIGCSIEEDRREVVAAGDQEAALMVFAVLAFLGTTELLRRGYKLRH
jgi:hypothetical protein